MENGNSDAFCGAARAAPRRRPRPVFVPRSPSPPPPFLSAPVKPIAEVTDTPYLLELS